MKQTAVEWLIEQMKTYNMTVSVHNTSHQNVMDFYKAIEQAKEMEKEQIENAFNYGVYDGGGLIKKYKMSGEKYYNETFKSE
jgi:sulfatase maturation enzyme AslB (radical SAM superfamily)